MIELVSKVLNILEVCLFHDQICLLKSCHQLSSPFFQQYYHVSLKHSGSLFMYVGHDGGAYANNNYGNVYVSFPFFFAVYYKQFQLKYHLDVNLIIKL